MSEAEYRSLYEAIRQSIADTICSQGLDALKRTSVFASNDRVGVA